MQGKLRQSLMHTAFLSAVRRYSKNSSIRIGYGSAFWGDSKMAIPQLIHYGNVDVIACDYLSEITMSLLAKAQMKNPHMGFIPDFMQIAQHYKEIEQQGIKFVVNAGGINPLGCAQTLSQLLQEKSGGASQLRVAVVTGDNVMTEMNSSVAQSRHFLDEAGNPTALPENCLSSNAYLGAQPISAALNLGADIVITGRCTDSALVLGTLLHKFKWRKNDFDLLAAGSAIGHLIECGAQATGGIFTDHHLVKGWWNIGFPIAECHADGTAVISKSASSGGLVSEHTLAEQLIYEIGDPRRYELPDVVCDFSNIRLRQIADNEVHVSGAAGSPPSDLYKVSSTYIDSNRITAMFIVMGIDAAKKARRSAEAILNRARTILMLKKKTPFKRVHLQILGDEQSYGANRNPSNNPREVCVWMAVEHDDKTTLELLAMEIASAGTGMAPGITGAVGGRPKITPVVRLHSSFLPKSCVQPKIHFAEKEHSVDEDDVEPSSSFISNNDHHDKVEVVEEKTQKLNGIENGSSSRKYRLAELALARSGDKGNTCNIGVVARNERIWRILRDKLTERVVGEYMRHVFLCESSDQLGQSENKQEDEKAIWQNRIERFELPGIMALNFVLKDSLGGGGIASLRPDPQGKAFAQMLLDLELNDLPDDLI